MVSAKEGKWELTQLLYVDDTVLVADSKKKLERLVEGTGRDYWKRKLKVNVAKNRFCDLSEMVYHGRWSSFGAG